MEGASLGPSTQSSLAFLKRMLVAPGAVVRGRPAACCHGLWGHMRAIRLRTGSPGLRHRPATAKTCVKTWGSSGGLTPVTQRQRLPPGAKLLNVTGRPRGVFLCGKKHG